MKKLNLFFALMCFSVFAFAQPKGGVTWFDAGLKVKYGAAGLFNKALSDSPDYDFDLGLSGGFGIGARVGLNYDDHGLALEFMLNKGSQPMENMIDNTTFDINWNTYDIYALYRNSSNRGYFEIGPKYSLVNKVERDDPGDNTVDMTDDFQNYLSGVIGFGANLMGSETFFGMLGLRIEYGFTDAMTNIGRTNGSPVSDPNIYATDSNISTNLAFAGIVFELNWGIGYYAKAGCGQRSKMMKF